MAKTKQGGSTKLGRDSQAKRLGIKLYDGEKVKAGMVLVRQRGAKYLAGKNVGRGSDDTLYAMLAGKVKFDQAKKKRFDGRVRTASRVSVVPESK